MAIVINDFEVIAEPPPAPGAPAPQDVEGPPQPSAPEVERVLRRLAERLMRIEAH